VHGCDLLIKLLTKARQVNSTQVLFVAFESAEHLQGWGWWRRLRRGIAWD